MRLLEIKYRAPINMFGNFIHNFCHNTIIEQRSSKSHIYIFLTELGHNNRKQYILQKPHNFIGIVQVIPTHY